MARLDTAQLDITNHNNRCLEAFHCSSCEWLVSNRFMSRRHLFPNTSGVRYSQRLDRGKSLGTGCCEWLWSIATWANRTLLPNTNSCGVNFVLSCTLCYKRMSLTPGVYPTRDFYQRTVWGPLYVLPEGRVPLAHIPIAHIHSHRPMLRVFPLDYQSENFILN